MKYTGTLLAVSSMAKAREFYEKVMGQKVIRDAGIHVSFENGLSLQSNYGETFQKTLNRPKRSNNFQLYFEVDNIDLWQDKINDIQGIEFIHKIKSYPWGQRAMRFYDHDKFIVEVSESMESVAKRFLAQGVSIEETAKRTMFSVEFIAKLK